MVKNESLLTKTDLDRLATFVKKEFGISFDEQKLKRFTKKIETLMHKHGIDDFNVLYHKVRYAKDEILLQELINTVTINETYFWRESEQFNILAEEILPEISKTKQKIRILVAPTSSGEELYSIMFSIMEEGSVMQKCDIELVGIDIDSSVIRKAKIGLYTRRSVEKLPKHMLEKYFTKTGDYYKLDNFFIDNANFMQANIFDESLIHKLGRFDIIFSRNMLIYFDKNEKKKAFDIFFRLLYPGGYLFLGHADANGIDKSVFQPVKSGFQIYKRV